MSRHYIATKLHTVLQGLRDIGLPPDKLPSVFLGVERMPHYVIDQSLLDLLSRSDVAASITAMREAGVCRLPFSEMLIELPFGSAGQLRSFTVLWEGDDDEIFAQHAQYDDTIGKIGTDDYDDEYRIELGAEGFNIFHDHDTDDFTDNLIMLSLSIALLMLNIQGVGKEVITPTQLNRGRVATGKVPVPTHTVMRVAHVYDRDGNKHAVGSGGHTKAVHMRAGHTRRQHYGPGNRDTKIIFVPPVLVNFHPGAEVKVPRRIIAA